MANNQINAYITHHGASMVRRLAFELNLQILDDYVYAYITYHGASMVRRIAFELNLQMLNDYVDT